MNGKMIEDSASECDVLVQEKAFKKLTRIAKRPPIDIEFQDLSYSVSGGGLTSGDKSILKSLSGTFKSGDFTAILGPSGSGKTTLLNILAGYVGTGVTGSIKMNNRPRDMKIFHKLTAYIMQEDRLQPRLSVEEAMMIAANLKLGSEVGFTEKQEIVEEILRVLGLSKCATTWTEQLSGGQRKRLAVALELVNNPPVIFLDEPTSGLDSVAIKQIIEILGILTHQGRTIICTIHQPPSSIFEQFDQVYFIAYGECIYNGAPHNIVPHLSGIGYCCPTTHSPADYIIELANIDQECVQRLVSSVQNGKINRRTSLLLNQFSKIQALEDLPDGIYGDTTQPVETNISVNFPTSFWTQLHILLSRMYLQYFRNRPMLYIQIIHHVTMGILVGSIYYKAGNDASMAMANYKFPFCILVFFMYTYIMIPVLLMPLETEIFRREYANRWYGLKAFYTALVIRNIPIMVPLGLVFLVISYIISDQPMDLHTFTFFSVVAILIGIASEALGTVIGCTFNILGGCVIGPSTFASCLAVSMYGMGYSTGIEPHMKIVQGLDYLRYGLVGLCHALYGYERPHFHCDEDAEYCHYKDPALLLRDLGMADTTYTAQIIGLVGFIVLFRIAGYFSLRYSFTSEFSQRILIFVKKILKRR